MEDGGRVRKRFPRARVRGQLEIERPPAPEDALLDPPQRIPDRTAYCSQFSSSVEQAVTVSGPSTA